MNSAGQAEDAQDTYARIGAVRRFNRFYTRQIGVLRKTYLDSPYSLGEMRVLYEIAHGEAVTAKDIGRALDLDAGYLSRVLRNFERRGLITRKASEKDARQSNLALTARGRQAFDPAEERSQRDVADMLDKLPPPDQSHLVSAMQTIEKLLGAPTPGAAGNPVYTLRAPRFGDFGWIISRHAVLYAQEYGWGEPFEGLCAQIVADFVNNYDPSSSVAGSPRGMAKMSVASCWSRTMCPASRVSACCWSIHKHAASSSARAWSTNA